MELLNVEVKNYRPNIRILQRNIITFGSNNINLFSLSGYKLDTIKFFNFNDICMINNKFFIAFEDYLIYGIKINNNKMIYEILIFNSYTIKNIIYLKNNHLLAVCDWEKINLLDIDNIKGQPIQIIFTNSNNLYNFNKNLFISYSKNNISLYKNRNGDKHYQLLNIYKFKKIQQLIKLNNNLLLILENNNLYTININNMKTYRIYLFLYYDDYTIKFIYNDKHYLYIYINDIIYSIQFFENQFQIIKSIKMKDPLLALNCLCYLQINQDNILIKCEENKIIDNRFIDDDDDISIYFKCLIGQLYMLHANVNHPFYKTCNECNECIRLLKYIFYEPMKKSSFFPYFQELELEKIICFERTEKEIRLNKIKKITEKNYYKNERNQIKKIKEKNYNKKIKNYFKKNYR